MRRANWLGLERSVDPLPDSGRIVAGLAPASGSDLPDAANTLGAHPPMPQRYRAAMDSELRGAHLRGVARRPSDENPRSQHHLLRR